MRKIFENLKIALRAIWSNKIRSFLTTLGVIIGVFAVILLMAIGQGAKKQVASEFTALGTNFIFVVPGKFDVNEPTTFNPAASLGENTLTTDDVKKISEVDKVKNAVPINIVGGQVRYNNKVATQSFVVATWPEFYDIGEMKLSSGRIFTKDELNDKSKVVVLGPKSKEELFGDGQTIGKKINIRGTEVKVVGVLEKSPISLRMFGVDFDNIVYLPFTTAEKITGSSQIFRIIIQTETEEDIDKVALKVKEVMLGAHRGVEDFTVIRQEDILNILDSILSILTIMITAIAAISLIVGGIGIMNIMLVSVTERTKEIGLRKAVGATKFDILTQFLIESVSLSLSGGILGVGAAYLISDLISRFSTFRPVLTLNSILLAFGVALVVGIIFGVAPAIRASRLDPIEALRHE